MTTQSDNNFGGTAPEVSILVLTHNRRALLERNLASIFKQTFKNYEILLLDDYSSDDTEEYVKSLSDKRVRYHRNEQNMGKENGDWWAIRKCIYELMKGKYFIYLCDDDYWLPETLLEELLDKHHKYPNLSFAFGMHAHCNGHRLTPREVIVKEIPNCYTKKNMFPEGYMSGLDYLSIFSSNPCGKNCLEGATLFSREKLLECRAFSAPSGTKWQAGYMFKMGPAVVGDVFFIDQPFVIAGVDSTNASYSRTQVDHFWDIVASISDSFIFLKASPTYEAFYAKEKNLVFALYNKVFCNFVQTWYRNQILRDVGFHFPDTPDVYFRERLKFSIFKKSFSKTLFKSTLETKGIVLISMMPAFVLRMMYSGVKMISKIMDSLFSISQTLSLIFTKIKEFK